MRFFLLSTILVLSLTACRSVMDPSFMPAGYSYHQNTYNSPPGPPAKSIGYKYTQSENDAALQQWDRAVQDILLKARAHGMDLPATLHLTTDMQPSAFQSSYDFVLRENLKLYGHTLKQAPDIDPDIDSVALFYSVHDPDNKNTVPTRLYNGDLPSTDSAAPPKSKNMELIIGLLENDALVQKTSGTYELPLYGYVGGYKNPLKQKTISLSDSMSENKRP